MNLRKIIILLMPFFLIGCKSVSSFPNRSYFVSDNKIVIGMSVSEFISFYGEPYKKNFFFDADSVFNEKLYYKEQIYNRVFYTIISAFEFRNSKLISQNQEPEKKLHDDCNCNK